MQLTFLHTAGFEPAMPFREEAYEAPAFDHSAIYAKIKRKNKILGWVGFEPTTSRLKAECSTPELPTRFKKN